MIYSVYKMKSVGTANVDPSMSPEDIVAKAVPGGSAEMGQYVIYDEDDKAQFVIFKLTQNVVAETSESPFGE